MKIICFRNFRARQHCCLFFASHANVGVLSGRRCEDRGSGDAASQIGLRRYAVCRVKSPAKCCLLRTATMAHRITTKIASGSPAGAIKV